MMTPNKEYSLSNENLWLPIQMQLSGKLKTFSEIFIAFLKSILIFKHFDKKDLHGSGISEAIDSESSAYLNA